MPKTFLYKFFESLTEEQILFLGYCMTHFTLESFIKDMYEEIANKLHTLTPEEIHTATKIAAMQFVPSLKDFVPPDQY